MKESTGFSNGPYKGSVSGEMGTEQGRRRQIFLSSCIIARGMLHSPLEIIIGDLTLSVFEGELYEALKISQRIAMTYPQDKKT